MKKGSKIISLLLLFSMLLTISLTGCAPKSTSSTTKNKKIKIGVCMQGFTGIFCQYIVAGIKNYIQTNGLSDKYDVVIVDAENKSDKQLSQVETFISSGVDAIILNPVDRVASSPAVASAKEAGIPILTVNTSTENQKDAAAYVGSDDVIAGKLQIDYFAKMLNGKGNIAVIQGSMGQSAQIGRWKGYTEGIKKYPGMKIIVNQTADWATDKAQTLMENWIQSGKKIDAVACNCDTEAIGAQNAIDAAKLRGKILVGGMDAIPDVMKSIKNGGIACSVWQDGIGQGANSIRLAIEATKGTKISDFLIPYELITKDNIAKYEKKAADRDALNMKYNH